MRASAPPAPAPRRPPAVAPSLTFATRASGNVLQHVTAVSARSTFRADRSLTLPARFARLDSASYTCHASSAVHLWRSPSAFGPPATAHVAEDPLRASPAPLGDMGLPPSIGPLRSHTRLRTTIVAGDARHVHDADDAPRDTASPPSATSPHSRPFALAVARQSARPLRVQRRRVRHFCPAPRFRITPCTRAPHHCGSPLRRSPPAACCRKRCRWGTLTFRESRA